VPNIDPSSPTSSSDPPECRVVLATTPLHVWAQKTLQFVGSDIGIPSYTRRTRFNFSLMTKFLAIDYPSTCAHAKDKIEWEKAMNA